MSYKKLEVVADGVRPLLPTVAGYGAPDWRIDARRVLESTLPKAGFHYHIAEKSELRECAGFTVPEYKLVVLREDVYEGLFTDDVFSRSTVVHELSHIVLGHAITLCRGAVFGKHQFFEDSEWQAKSLTAAIMMPIPACAAATGATQLAMMCGTSVESATYRIENLVKHKAIPEKSYIGQLFG